MVDVEILRAADKDLEVNKIDDVQAGQHQHTNVLSCPSTYRPECLVLEKI